MHVNLTSELLWNPEEVNDKGLTSTENDVLISRTRDGDIRSINLKKKIRRLTKNRLAENPSILPQLW